MIGNEWIDKQGIGTTSFDSAGKVLAQKFTSSKLAGELFYQSSTQCIFLPPYSNTP